MRGASDSWSGSFSLCGTARQQAQPHRAARRSRRRSLTPSPSDPWPPHQAHEIPTPHGVDGGSGRVVRHRSSAGSALRSGRRHGRRVADLQRTAGGQVARRCCACTRGLSPRSRPPQVAGVSVTRTGPATVTGRAAPFGQRPAAHLALAACGAQIRVGPRGSGAGTALLRAAVGGERPVGCLCLIAARAR